MTIFSQATVAGTPPPAEEHAVERIVDKSTALAPIEASVAVLAMMEKAMDKGPDGVAMLERLAELHDKMQRRNAELEFASALVEFQNACPPIPRSSTAEIVTKSGGKFGYKFADFEQIVETVRPHLHRQHFSFTFDSKTDGKTLTCTCTLRHVNGHSVSAGFTLPTDTASAMSAQQAVGAALTFAKRQCLVSVLGLSLTDPDPDQQGDPTTITPEQVASLKSLLEEVKGDPRKFAAIYGVERLEDMPARNYRGAVATLEAKRKAGA